MNFHCILIIVLLALAIHLPGTAHAQLGLNWLSKAGKVTKTAEELSLAGKLGSAAAVLTRAEMLAIAGSSGFYLDVRGTQIVVHSLQDATKTFAIATQDLANSLGPALSAAGADASAARVVMTRNTAESLRGALDEVAKNYKIFVFDKDIGTVPFASRS
jgi:hypothetical protein